MSAKPGAGGILGLRTAIYHVRDLPRAKAWYAAAFGVEPYFDEPYYAGSNIGGFELGLDPSPGGSVAYWRVKNLDAAVTRFERHGGAVKSPARDVGEGIRVATVADPIGSLVGPIENPHFGSR